MEKTFNWTSAIPWVISILAIGWGIMQYTLSTTQANRVPFLQKQLEIVLAATDAAGELATYKDADKWREAYNRFRVLYVGKMVMVEDTELAQAMKTFGDAVETLGSPNGSSRRDDLLGPTITLDHVARAFILKSWGVDLRTLNNEDAPNAPDPKLNL